MWCGAKPRVEKWLLVWCGVWVWCGVCVCVVWYVVCGMWYAVCGMRSVACAVWPVVCGMWHPHPRHCHHHHRRHHHHHLLIVIRVAPFYYYCHTLNCKLAFSLVVLKYIGFFSRAGDAVQGAVYYS